VLTGDGEQLMGLGGLATIAAYRPANLTLVVLDNSHFGETSMQFSHSGLGVDLHLIAQAAGFAASREIRTLREIAQYRSEKAPQQAARASLLSASRPIIHPAPSPRATASISRTGSAANSALRGTDPRGQLSSRYRATAV
jgi:hypothetical protein